MLYHEIVRQDMVFKPLSPSAFIRHLKMVGWSLEKGSIDWNLYNENGKFVCTIQISHSSKAKTEVTARSVRKVEREFKERGWVWPPQKKLTKS